MNFIDKVVLITGAGSGMGEATAIHFAKLNAKLSLVDKCENNLNDTSEECNDIGAETLTITADLANIDELKTIVKKTIDKHGRLDVLVNCAAIWRSGYIQDIDIIDQFDEVIAVNLRAVVALTHYASPWLMKTKGSIVNISSVVGKIVSSDTVIYNISKAGVNHFTRCTALELSYHGVRVNSILPGMVKTNILANSGIDKEESDRLMNEFITHTPIQKFVEVEDIAKMVAFLASDEAKSITGAEVLMDNGLVLKGMPQ